MPLIVKDYTWSETETHVVIRVPLKGVKPNKADIFSSDLYIKVNFPPFLFEVHLFRAVIEEQCTVKIGNGLIVFHLTKREEGIWGQLCSEVDSKDELTEKRTAAVEHSHQRAKEDKEERAKKKREEEQFAIKQQMKLEEDDKERIEKQKQDERDKATSDLEKWKLEAKNHHKDIWTGKRQSAPPPPREAGQITVHFTHRPFTTAARESKIAEEQEWLTKMAAARKIKENPEKTMDERNPEFLKDRGVEFFKAKNYEAAINAFSEGIQSNKLLPFLYSNRAACYLAMDNYESCIDDCCKALELYYPVVPSNYLSRARVFVRRGTAYARQGEYDLAVQDYEAAVKLSPDDVKLKEDYEKLREYSHRNKN